MKPHTFLLFSPVHFHCMSVSFFFKKKEELYQSPSDPSCLISLFLPFRDSEGGFLCVIRSSGTILRFVSDHNLMVNIQSVLQSVPWNTSQNLLRKQRHPGNCIGSWRSFDAKGFSEQGNHAMTSWSYEFSSHLHRILSLNPKLNSVYHSHCEGRMWVDS